MQKCIRTIDIDLVGDQSHLTLIEMLGNWSLGDYFKQGAIELSHEFLTDSRWLGFPVEHLHVTCFAGNDTVPRDDEAASAWRSLGIAEDHIHFLKDDNWWGPAGRTGPCGPTTEMYVDLHPDAGDDGRTPGNGDRHLEIWNDVFMQYDKTREGRFVPLQQQCVDTGMGVERTAAVLQGAASVYDVDVLSPVVATAVDQAGGAYGADGERDRFDPHSGRSRARRRVHARRRGRHHPLQSRPGLRVAPAHSPRHPPRAQARHSRRDAARHRRKRHRPVS